MIALRLTISHAWDYLNTLRFLGIVTSDQTVTIVTDARNVLCNIGSLKAPQEKNLQLDYLVIKRYLDNKALSIRHVDGYLNLSDLLTKGICKSNITFWQGFFGPNKVSPVHMRVLLEDNPSTEKEIMEKYDEMFAAENGEGVEPTPHAGE